MNSTQLPKPEPRQADIIPEVLKPNVNFAVSEDNRSLLNVKKEFYKKLSAYQKEKLTDEIAIAIAKVVANIKTQEDFKNLMAILEVCALDSERPEMIRTYCLTNMFLFQQEFSSMNPNHAEEVFRKMDESSQAAFTKMYTFFRDKL